MFGRSIPRVFGTFSAALAALVGCAKSDFTGGTETTNSNDVKRIVSTGQSLSFNSQTGGPNDVALQSNSLPAVAYYDKSSAISGTTATGALKYAYMMPNGSWAIEVIDANYGTAACGVTASFCVGAPNAATGSIASILKLSFNSKGLPAIAYVFGASLAGGPTKQIRFAERTAAGLWKISVAFASSTAVGVGNVAIAATVDPMKGVTLAFDAQDRPHITFAHYTQTATNSTVKYSFRTVGGIWYTTDITPNVTGAGTIAALGQGMNQSNQFICPTTGMPIASGMVVDAAGGVGKSLFMQCTALGTNGGCTTWTTTNLSTGCGASNCFSSGIAAAANSGTRTDLIMDPTTKKPILGAYNTTSTSMVVGTLPNACGVAQPTATNSWGAMTTVGSASQGLNGFRIASNGTKQFASFLSTTLDVRLSVFSAGAWFAAGNIVETTTVGADGVGLAYDSAADLLYTSYASLPAAGVGLYGNDIKVANVPSVDLVTAGAAGTVPIDVVDTLVTVFPSAAVPMLTSAVSKAGTVGYAFYYQDSTVANSRLYYGVRGGDPNNPIFTANPVTNQFVSAVGAFAGSYPSLTFDSTDNPAVAFYNGNVTDTGLVVARSNNRGSSFSLTVVDHIAANTGQFPSIASFGTALGVAYYDVTNTGLKFARYTPGSGWKRFSVDGIAGTGSCGNAAADAGSFASLVFTSAGYPVIAYQSNTDLRLAYASTAVTDTAFTWTCVTVDASAATRGAGISMTLTGADHPHFVHFDATAGTIRYATCSNDVISCLTTGPLAFDTSIIGGVGSLSTIVTKPSIAVGPSGDVFVAYYNASFQALALATKLTTATKWATEYIDQAETGSSFISAAGQYGSIALNSSGYPIVFYRSNENWLKYFSREPL